MNLTLRHRLALLFACAVAAALLVSGGATIAVIEIQTQAHRQDEIRRGEMPDDDDLLVVTRAAVAMGIVSPIVIAAAAVVGLYLARRALAPMREASRRAASARASELDLTLPVTGARLGSLPPNPVPTCWPANRSSRSASSARMRSRAGLCHPRRGCGPPPNSCPPSWCCGPAAAARRAPSSASRCRR